VSFTPNTTYSWQIGYQAALDRVRSQLTHAPKNSPVRLAKKTSNLFRDRAATQANRLDVRSFRSVFQVDPVNHTAEVGGMTTYEDLVAATLPYGLMPLCVPQLRTITLGGAVTGLGIESASFRNGTPHESVLEMDILTGTGDIITASGQENDPHQDLFYSFPNSYGSLGYALRLKIDLEPTKPFVHITHLRFDSAAALTVAMKDLSASAMFNGSPVHFLDGTVFSPTEQYLTVGTMIDAFPGGKN